MRLQSLTVPVEDLDERLREGVPYEWWRQHTPLWIDVVLHEDGSVTFTPNDYVTARLRKPPTPLKHKSMLQWAAEDPAFIRMSIR